MPIRKQPGLTAQIKDKLIQQALERKLRRAEQSDESVAPVRGEATPEKIPEQFYKFSLHPGYQQIRIINGGAARMGIDNPFFRPHSGVAGATTTIKDRLFVNYASYNYLDLSGDAEVSTAAKRAIDRYGTSVSASRLVSGERPVHRQLEQALARFYEVDDAIVLVSGHATNVTTIGYLFGPRDLILHDELVHNSILQGIALSGARRLPFAHNDWQSLETQLTEQRHHFERVLIVVEGIYSMDGDFPDLPRYIELKKKYRAFLMVDEAHSLGVMGKNGGGIRDHFGVDGRDVDIWMGTLSKTLAGCGGYIAGETALIEHLKFLVPGFLYSVGMSPPLAAASLKALEIMQREPERVQALQRNGQLFLQLAREAGIDIGTSEGLAVIPVITGSSIRAARLSAALFARGINALPILYPAVPEKAARIRFFVCCRHTEAQIRETIQVLIEELDRL
nr:aminotransferase class I/II-fold pyridoxal phosphate-dependent enzyme [uncultured Desulfobulbus sp.]